LRLVCEPAVWYAVITNFLSHRFMQIERPNEQSVLITAANAKIYLNLGKQALKVPKDQNVIILGNSKDANAYVVDEPGEYELYDISIAALENAEKKKGVADFFQVEIEGVFVTWQKDQTIEIAKDDWENLADSQILILNLEDHQEGNKLDKFISKHNPVKLVIINADSVTAEKLTGIPVKETVKKIKLANKDFTAEEFTTESIVLE